MADRKLDLVLSRVVFDECLVSIALAVAKVVIVVCRYQPQVELVHGDQLVYRKQQTHRVRAAGDADDGRSGGGEFETSPFSDEIANKAMHEGSLAHEGGKHDR